MQAEFYYRLLAPKLSRAKVVSMSRLTVKPWEVSKTDPLRKQVGRCMRETQHVLCCSGVLQQSHPVSMVLPILCVHVRACVCVCVSVHVSVGACALVRGLAVNSMCVCVCVCVCVHAAVVADCKHGTGERPAVRAR